jgi:3-dehydroquinate synthase
MTYACHLSAQFLRFRDTERVVALIEKYGLPTYAEFDKEMAFEVLQKDKKKMRNEMNNVLLEKIGKGAIKTIPMDQLKTIILSL